VACAGSFPTRLTTGPPVAEKLIRDRIPAIAAAQGRTLAVRIAGPEKMARLLGLKLVEETHEVLDALAAGRAPDLLDELADLQTVIEAIGERHPARCAQARVRGLRRGAHRRGLRDGKRPVIVALRP
jgi:predicted house-cleaning noncanonical NTP pyrophosphatase (MazG superfamily)